MISNNIYKRSVHNLRPIVLWVGLIVSFTRICFAQDAQFTSNSENMLFVNPAYAGNSDQMNAYAIHKNQYFGIFQTTSLGYDTKVKLFGKEQGMGITIFQDRYDMMENVNVNFMYAYKHDVWNGTISYGAQFGFNNSTWTGSLNDSVLVSDYGENYAAEIKDRYGNEVSDFKFDMGVGAFYSDDRLYLGASLSHIFKPELSVTEDETAYLFLQRTLSLTAGYTLIPVRHPEYEIKPSILFKTDGITFQTDLGANVWYKKQFMGGAGYRLQESIFFLAGWKMKNGLFVGTAYDMLVNKMALGSAGYGSLELFVKYSFSIEVEKRDFKYKSIRIL